MQPSSNDIQQVGTVSVYVTDQVWNIVKARRLRPRLWAWRDTVAWLTACII